MAIVNIQDHIINTNFILCISDVKEKINIDVDEFIIQDTIDYYYFCLTVGIKDIYIKFASERECKRVRNELIKVAFENQNIIDIK